MRRLALIIALCPTLAWANTFLFGTESRFPVAQVDSATFEVIARGGRVNAGKYWCSAGLYGLSLGVRSNTRIYLAVAEGPSVTAPGRKAVRFTLDPEAAGITPISPQLSLSVKAVGDNMTVTAARQFCFDDTILGF